MGISFVVILAGATLYFMFLRPPISSKEELNTAIHNNQLSTEAAKSNV